MNLFDGFLLVWLVIGFFRGRKNGMSTEVLLVLPWLLIIVAGGFFYRVLGGFLKQGVPAISQPWCNLLSYLFIAIILGLLCSKLRSVVGEKLIGCELFGKYEYYLGMLAGIVRFACIGFVFMAVLNFSIVTKADNDETVKMLRKNFEGFDLPTPRSIQQAVLFESFTGHHAQLYLSQYFINSNSSGPAATPAASPGPAAETIARSKERQMDEILGPAKK